MKLLKLIAGVRRFFGFVLHQCRTMPEYGLRAIFRNAVKKHNLLMAACCTSAIVAGVPSDMPFVWHVALYEKGPWYKTKEILYNEEDRKFLALAIYHEARGETFRGQVAVGFTIIERVKNKYFPSTVTKVVTDGGTRRHKCQFSFWCDGRPDKIRDELAWKESVRIANLILEGKLPNPVPGSVFYYNPKKTKKQCFHIDDHLLGKIGNHLHFSFSPYSERKRCNARKKKKDKKLLAKS